MANAHVAEALRAAADGKFASCLRAVTEIEAMALEWPGQGSVLVLRNFTLDSLGPAVQLAGFRRGLKSTVQFGDFDAYAAEILDSAGPLARLGPDLVVLALWLDGLALAFDAEGRLQPGLVLAHLRRLVAEVLARSAALVALNTFLPPLHTLADWADAPGLEALNRDLRQLAAETPRVVLADLAAMAAEGGREASLDPRAWFHFRAPLRFHLVQRWGDDLGQRLAALKGGVRKVLVLDCDNTLWGGVIGEEGPEGIQLDAHAYPGAAYVAFQRQIRQLQRQGVLIALCSKNNELDVWEVLERHPACVLRRDHLAAWRINWDDKVANLQALAKELNLGLDSFVFVDDSPVECAHVATSLPMVEVLPVPTVPHALPRLLREYTGFRPLVQTAEDAERTQYYQVERQRREEADRIGDLDGFLASLDLQVTIGPVVPSELSRAAQLTQKTNQFNATTRRYGEGEVNAMVQSADHLVLTMSVVDKFGEYGLTGLAVLERQGDAARLDTFLMSCRILGRKLERVLLAEAVRQAQVAWGITEVVAEYRPTPKNGQMAEFFPGIGFASAGGSEAERRYRTPVSALHVAAPSYIKVVRR